MARFKCTKQNGTYLTTKAGYTFHIEGEYVTSDPAEIDALMHSVSAVRIDTPAPPPEPEPIPDPEPEPVPVAKERKKR